MRTNPLHVHASPAIRLPHLAPLFAAHQIVRPEGQDDWDEVYALGQKLLGSVDLVPKSHIQDVDDWTGQTLWLVREPADGGGSQITGFHVILPLSPHGESTLREGCFNPRSVYRSWVAAPGEACAGIYCWSFGGATKHARTVIMIASFEFRWSVFRPIPVYARGATGDGVEAMAKLGYTPLFDALPDLYVSEPASAGAV